MPTKPPRDPRGPRDPNAPRTNGGAGSSRGPRSATPSRPRGAGDAGSSRSPRAAGGAGPYRDTDSGSTSRPHSARRRPGATAAPPPRRTRVFTDFEPIPGTAPSAPAGPSKAKLRTRPSRFGDTTRTFVPKTSRFGQARRAREVERSVKKEEARLKRESDREKELAQPLEAAPDVPKKVIEPFADGRRRFGVVAIIGRPNAGKSTILNQILGHKVSIVSAKPQTTRNRIVGILNDPRGQIAFLDTPGIHKPLHRLNVRMMDHVRSSLSEADVLVVMIDASEAFGRGDEYVLEMVREQKGKEDAASRTVAVLNKIDTVRKHKLLPLMEQYGRTAVFDDIVPVSAANGDGIDDLVTLFFNSMEAGDPLYPVEDYTTQPERFFAAEIIREKVLRHTSDELPYTTAVSIQRYEEDEKTGLIKIFATILVERETQKPIVIGKGGDMIKKIGSEARIELETTLGTKVFIDLHVAVHAQWREDEHLLAQLEWPLE